MNRLTGFFQTESRRLVNHVRSRIDDAEDIVQEVMLNLFDKANISIPIENLTAYIYQSLKYKIIDLFRKRSLFFGRGGTGYRLYS